MAPIAVETPVTISRSVCGIAVVMTMEIVAAVARGIVILAIVATTAVAVTTVIIRMAFIRAMCGNLDQRAQYICRAPIRAVVRITIESMMVRITILFASSNALSILNELYIRT